MMPKPTPTPTPTTTPESPERHENRRAHTKSRNGCLVCKRRRVKCDERHPRCRNCAIGDRLCSYGPNTNKGSSPLAGSAFTALSSCSSSASSRPGYARPLLSGSNLSALSIQGGFTALHMVLLYHATTSMNDIMAVEGDVHTVISLALGSAHQAPYLLDQLLALAALHRSTQEPETASMFHNQATELQTRALGLFNETRDNLLEPSFIPSFIFATLVGIHTLHNTLSEYQRTVGAFVTSFVNYMRIHRGVRTVTGPHWDELLQSDLKSLLYISQWMTDAEPSVPGTETAQLRTRLESQSASLNPSIKASLEALRWVQWMLDLKTQASSTSSTSTLGVHAVLAWPLVVPDEFVDILHQRQPEALVVLAFFGAALHQHREFWVFGDAGSVLVQSITDHVGLFWRDALAWPLEVIAKDVSDS